MSMNFGDASFGYVFLGSLPTAAYYYITGRRFRVAVAAGLFWPVVWVAHIASGTYELIRGEP